MNGIKEKIKRNVQVYTFIKQHECRNLSMLRGRHSVPVIEEYFNNETGECEWFYVMYGFYNAIKIQSCPFCEVQVPHGE